jgi:peptidoglycan/xylan/chitin deacetylase (PgdA/CDA1 family)
MQNRKFSVSTVHVSRLLALLIAMGSSACSGGDGVTPVNPQAEGVDDTMAGESDPSGEVSEELDDGPASAEPDAAPAGSAPGSEDCDWPEGQAAVSLTYDDSMPTQLSTAAPALAEHGLRATFFLTDVRTNQAPWKALLSEGHELAAHTFNHPCPAAAWVTPGNAAEDYDLARMETELDEQVALLKEMGQPEPLSYAYPCGISWVGDASQSYVPLVQERFHAARGVNSTMAGLSPDMSNVPAYFLSGTGEELIAKVEAAQAAGSWVVFGFHGIGGDWEITPTESHEALLQYLDDESENIYVAPFGEVAQCLGRE